MNALGSVASSSWRKKRMKDSPLRGLKRGKNTLGYRGHVTAREIRRKAERLERKKINNAKRNQQK
jgi:pyruvate/oxaloacetate carboxyltransferase